MIQQDLECAWHTYYSGISLIREAWSELGGDLNLEIIRNLESYNYCIEVYLFDTTYTTYVAVYCDVIDLKWWLLTGSDAISSWH